MTEKPEARRPAVATLINSYVLDFRGRTAGDLAAAIGTSEATARRALQAAVAAGVLFEADAVRKNASASFVTRALRSSTHR